MTKHMTPRGWASAILGDLITVVRGVSYKKIDARYVAEEGLVPIIRATNIEQELNFDNLVYVPGHYVKQEQFLRPGDIVIAASSGSRSVVGKAAHLKREWTGSFGAFCLGLRPEASTDDRYIAWFTQSEEYRNRVSTLSAGININNLKREHIEETPIPLPPLAEQRRIVAEIETQFTRLDASVAALRRAQANLKRYRASVLKAACEGRLVPTEAELAHSEGRDYEAAGVLLERILAERRARWESQEKRRGKYKEPSTPDASAQPELPEGWVWATIEQLLARSEYGTSVKCSYDAAGLPVLRIPNIVAGEIDLTDIKYATQPVPIESETSLTKGDVLMCRTNGSVRLVGKTAVVTSDLEPYHGFASYLLRFRLMETKFIPKWFHIYTTSQLGRAFIEKNAASSAGQNNVSLSLIHTMPMPLPPLAEQRRIVADVERRLSVVQQTEATVEASLARAERLRQSILKQAFSGKLVPQDPDDEPASALLERIKAEREAEAEANASVKNKSRRRSTRKATA